MAKSRVRKIQPQVRCHFGSGSEFLPLCAFELASTNHGSGAGDQGPEKTHKRKVTCSGSGVRRFTGGSRPQGHLPRLISDGIGLVFSTIRDPRNIPLCAIPLCVFLSPWRGPPSACSVCTGSGPRNTDKHKGIFTGSGVRRFTGVSRPQGHLPRLISDGLGPVFPKIRDPGHIHLFTIPLRAFVAP